MLWKSYIFCRNCRYKIFSYTFYSCFKSVVAWNGLTSYIWVLSCVDCFAVLICAWLCWINKFHFYQYMKTIMWFFFFITCHFCSICAVITNQSERLQETSGFLAELTKWLYVFPFQKTVLILQIFCCKARLPYTHKNTDTTKRQNPH